MSKENIYIKNRKARLEFELIETFVAGIQLLGTEIKSLREGKANIAESYCLFQNHEVYVRNMTIQEYSFGNSNNHEPKRDRKLLLTKSELRKLEGKVKDTGVTLVPLALFINDKGLAKLEFALAKGKKLFDKRESIKQRDIKRELGRIKL